MGLTDDLVNPNLGNPVTERTQWTLPGNGVFNPVRVMEGELLLARATGFVPSTGFVDPAHPGYAVTPATITTAYYGDPDPIHIFMERNLDGQLFGFVLPDHLRHYPEHLDMTAPVGSNYRPIPGARVVVFDQWHNIIASTISDANGFFYFNNLPPGVYVLFATHPPEWGGHITVPTPVIMPEGGGSTQATIYLDRVQNQGFRLMVDVRDGTVTGPRIANAIVENVNLTYSGVTRQGVYMSPIYNFNVNHNLPAPWQTGNLAVSADGFVTRQITNISTYVNTNYYTWYINETLRYARIVVALERPMVHSVTFHLYTNNAALINEFNDDATFNATTGFWAFTVPVRPGHAPNHPLLNAVREVGHIYGQPNTPGFAFWGWFEDSVLTATGRTRVVSGATFRRPALGTNCGMSALLTQIQNATTQAQVDAIFGVNNYNVDMYSIWGLWGDVLDDDVVTTAGLERLRRYLNYSHLPMFDTRMNRTAAMVTHNGIPGASDMEMIRQYLAYMHFPWINIVLGEEPPPAPSP